MGSPSKSRKIKKRKESERRASLESSADTNLKPQPTILRNGKDCKNSEQGRAMEQALEQAWAPAVGSGRRWRWRGEMFRSQDTKPGRPSERQRLNGCKVSQARVSGGG